ncbi:MAG: glycosyltransferase [Clostridia bacterium]|nr:glycosyltransferase [Clostridia bacterium]
MRILMINTVYALGSTGKIVKQISEKADNQGFESLIAHRYESKGNEYPDNVIPVSSWLDCHIHNRLSQLTMFRGGFSRYKTFKFLKKLENFNPDLIHLHNIHGNFINLSMLFRFIKKRNIKVIWTLHDCWPLTGNCKHFAMAGCSKWKSGCGGCPQKGKALLDSSHFMYKKKFKMFDGIKEMTIVTPSEWLADLVRQSPMSRYPIEIINNGIDLDVFAPAYGEFRKNYGLNDKKVVLGVAFGWDKRKGLDVFVEISSQLPEDYQIILVGTTDEIDSVLPQNIISIHRTKNQKELAAIYTAADVFVNPTREDTYPTVNMEALACGTPVITFDTGGSGEMLDETCGYVVKCNDIDALVSRIVYTCENRPFSQEACLAKAKSFNMNDKFNEYIKLYEELV